MIYKIINVARVHPHGDAFLDHIIEDESGRTIKVDLFVDSSFEGLPEHETSEDMNEYARSLIGKRVSIGNLRHYDGITMIAENVKIIEPETAHP